MTTTTQRAPRSSPPPPPAPTTAPMDAVVAIYPTHDAAHHAVVVLERAGFDMTRLSIVGRGYHTEEQPLGYYNARDRIKVWGKRGAFWGALFGILLSPAVFLIPMVGHVMVLGPLASGLLGAAEGGLIGGGTSALAAGLFGLGLPKDAVVRYEAAVKADKFLLVAHGNADEVARARELLRSTSPEELTSHAAAHADSDASSGHSH